MDTNEILLNLCSEQREMAKSHETHRFNSTSLMLIWSGAIITYISQVGPKNIASPMIYWFLMVLGFWSSLLSYKHYERFRFHVGLSGTYKDAIEQATGVPLQQMRAAYKAKHQNEYWLFTEIRLHYLWGGLNLGVAVVAIIFLVQRA